MEKYQKIMLAKCTVVSVLLLLVSVNARCQFSPLRHDDAKPKYEYPGKVKLLRVSGICVAAAAPVVGGILYKSYGKKTETTFSAYIYSLSDDRLLDTIHGLTYEEICRFESPYADSYEDFKSVTTTKEVFPKWTPFVVGGVLLAVGAVLWGIGEYEAYSYRVEVNRRNLELSFLPTGIVMKF